MWTSSACAEVLLEDAKETLSDGTPISTTLLKTSDALCLAFSAKLAPPVGLTATTSKLAEGICSRALEIDSKRAVE